MSALVSVADALCVGGLEARPVDTGRPHASPQWRVDTPDGLTINVYDDRGRTLSESTRWRVHAVAYVLEPIGVGHSEELRASVMRSGATIGEAWERVSARLAELRTVLGGES